MEEQIYPTVTRVALLRTVASDLMESLEDLQGPALKSLDEDLEKAGLPTLSSMRTGEQKKIQRILAAGSLRNENDYRLLVAHLSNQTSDLWRGSQREKAAELVRDFEHRAGKGMR
jgi:hypothetical protein